MLNTFGISFTHEQSENLSIMGIDAMQEVRYMAVEETAKRINDLIDEGKEIYVNHLVRNLSLVSEATMAPQFRITMEIEWK